MLKIAEISSLEELKNHFQDQLPKHMGLILDGNRRWSRRQGKENTLEGHLAGYNTLRKILLPIFDSGIHYLSVYALSSENIRKRSSQEIQYLFNLLLQGINDILKEPLIHEHKVRVRLIGRISMFPENIQQEIKKINAATKKYNDNFINICVAYDGQEEIIDTIRKIVELNVQPAQINHDLVRAHLYAPNFPPVDYIIRTGMQDGARISGFLLWDSSYAEFCFRRDLWPDYSDMMLLEDLKEYVRRNRRKGA